MGMKATLEGGTEKVNIPLKHINYEIEINTGISKV